MIAHHLPGVRLRNRTSARRPRACMVDWLNRGPRPPGLRRRRETWATSPHTRPCGASQAGGAPGTHARGADMTEYVVHWCRCFGGHDCCRLAMWGPTRGGGPVPQHARRLCPVHGAVSARTARPEGREQLDPRADGRLRVGPGGVWPQPGLAGVSAQSQASARLGQGRWPAGQNRWPGCANLGGLWRRQAAQTASRTGPGSPGAGRSVAPPGRPGTVVAQRTQPPGQLSHASATVAARPG